MQQIRSRALADVKRLKDELNGTKTAFTENLLKEIARVERLNGMEETLRSILNKLNLNEIHWNKGKGNYSVQIDNGYCISYYGIYFSGDQMTVSMSEPMAHSEIFGNYEDGYSDYMSESESTIWFVFRMTYGGIVFEHIKTAG